MDSLKDRFPNLPERISGLGQLACNLWWCWHPAARMLFKRLDREVWKDAFYNPVKVLKILPKERLAKAAEDADFLQHYDQVLAQYPHEMEAQVCWFTENVLDTACLPIAYFSLEYGLHRSLPFYAGGLGFLAGDHLKECSDLGLPLVAVGFMYPDGYLRQKIRVDGWQDSADEILDRDSAPISRVLDDKGIQLVVQVPFIPTPIHVAVWQVKVGRIPLYLMDTALDINDPGIRRISDHLYISDREQRLLQEIVLGIGGSEVLKALGIQHSILHMNEGHPAFALLERVRERLETGMDYEKAVEQVKATSVFTTHTPVPAGHDVFSFDLMDKYFGNYYPQLGLSREAFFQLGQSPADPNAGFNMTAFALRMSVYCNGVSKKHGEVARRMWQPLWPDKPVEQVPIDYVTNGVHVPTWIEPKMELLLNRYLGADWLTKHDDPKTWEAVDSIPDREFWEVHHWLKRKLIDRIREAVRQRWVEERGDYIVPAGGTLLDPTALTIGFARRFATYKRADLIFSDLSRLAKILNNPWRPVQIIFAGKAHPADDPGKRILQRVFNFARDPGLGGRIAFVEDYGEQLAQYLVHGVDVWLNNPIPPLEACGTSGMKASLNGVPNLSILDGWWLEGFNGDNGWAFGGEDVPDRDASDAAAIYDILEQKVVPLFYTVDDEGTPLEWVKLLKAAMKSTGPAFSARRMVKQYSLKFYQEALKSSESQK
jgi:starch phosphorylase